MKADTLLSVTFAIIVFTSGGIGIAATTSIDGGQQTALQAFANEVNPTDPDADGDGFRDTVEASDQGLMQHADPQQKDIFIEISYANESLAPSNESLNRLQQAFDNAPVENPNGEDGIQVHIVRSDEPDPTAPTTISPRDYHSDVTNGAGYWETQDQGTYHVLMVDRIEEKESWTSGVTYPSEDAIIIRQQNDAGTGDSIMHEIGHQFGLLRGEYIGVDGLMDWERYPSTMNYRSPDDCTASHTTSTCINGEPYSYSSGVGHDDWEFIAENLADEQADASDIQASVP